MEQGKCVLPSVINYFSVKSHTHAMVFWHRYVIVPLWVGQWQDYWYEGSNRPRTNRPVTVPTHSAPRNHWHGNDHQLSLNDFKIIDSDNNEHELRILESLYICEEMPSLNIDQSATPLPLF